MTQERMGIRAMCETFDVTPRTLRFYETKGLLAPHREGQRRLYSRRDRARLKLILRGKRFGFSLEEIRQMLDLYDRADGGERQLSHSYALAKQRLTDLERRRAELDAIIGDLRAQIAWGAEMLEGDRRRSAAK